MKIKKILLFVFLFAFSAFLIYYFFFKVKITKIDKNAGYNEDKNQNSNQDVNNTNQNQKEVTTDKVDLILSSMSVEQKVGQLFICGFRKNSSNQNMYVLNDQTKAIVKKYNIGGVILFSENMQNEVQLKKLVEDINKTSQNIPLFISSDVEGGLVDRLAKVSIVKSLPYISKLGATNDSNLSYEYGKIIARRLKYFGFNLDFAPVCDLDTSDAIMYRSFGKDPNIVSKMVQGYIKGLGEYNIASTLKHFPGLGSSVGNSHDVVATSNISLTALEKNDFLPFKAGIDSGSNIVMINHIVYNNLLEKKLPASLNSDIYQILKDKLSFSGIIITDGLEMGGVTKQNIETTPAYAAFVAGADMLLLPQDLDKSYNEILNAVKKNQISMQRLDSSVQKIIRYKEKMGMFSNTSQNLKNLELEDKNDQEIINKINNY